MLFVINWRFANFLYDLKNIGMLAKRVLFKKLHSCRKVKVEKLEEQYVMSSMIQPTLVILSHLNQTATALQ